MLHRLHYTVKVLTPHYFSKNMEYQVIELATDAGSPEHTTFLR